MTENKSVDTFENLKKKLARIQKREALLSQKVKLLEEMVEDSKVREEDSRARAADAGALMHELVARQRELNVMLNRSNTLLANVYEANKMLTVECHDAIQALPAPKKAELEQTMSRVEELFKKTGIPDAEVSDVVETRKEFQDDALVSSEKGSWAALQEHKPPFVDAEPVDEPATQEERVYDTSDEEYIESEEYADGESEEDQRRKWWNRFRRA